MTYCEYTQSIITSRGQWCESIRESICERHHIIPKCLGGLPDKLNWEHHENVIWLTPQEHYTAHKLLAQENPTIRGLVASWEMMEYPKGKTKRDFPISEQEYYELRALWSTHMREKNPFLDSDGHPWNYGKHDIYSQDTLNKIRAPRPNMQGRKKSAETRKRMSEADKLIDRSNRVCAIKDKKAITDGETVKFIRADEELPEGWSYGNCKTSGTHDLSNYWSNIEMQQRASEVRSGERNGMYNNHMFAGGNNPNSLKRYYYNDLVFECRKDLLFYLQQNVDSSVTAGALRKIVEKNYGNKILKKFVYIIEQITWRWKDEDKVD